MRVFEVFPFVPRGVSGLAGLVRAGEGWEGWPRVGPSYVRGAGGGPGSVMVTSVIWRKIAGEREE